MDFDGIFGDGLFDAFFSGGSGAGEGSLFDWLFESGSHGSAFRNAGAFEDAALGREFASFFRGLGSDAFETAWQAFVWDKVHKSQNQGGAGGFSGFSDAFSGKSGASKAQLEDVTEVAKAHALFGQQLKMYAGKQEALSALSEEYHALGSELPSEEMLKKAHRTLLKHLHPDVAEQDVTGIAKEINAARDTLQDAAKTQTYTQWRQNNPQAFEEILSKLKGVNWEKAYEARARMHRKALPPPQEEFVGLRKVLQETHPTTRAVAIGAAIAGTGLAIYGLASHAEKQPKKRDKISHTEALKQREEANPLQVARS
jgi:hypothetical protein